MGYVTFEDPTTGEVWRSDTDLHLIRENVSVGSPQIRRRRIQVPGMDGTLDASGWCGRTLYDSRPLTISAGKAIVDRFAQDSLIKNVLHGREMRITLSDDPEYYYLGRIEVGEWIVEAGIGKVAIRVECDPYKYRQMPTMICNTVPKSGTMNIVLPCERMLTVPTITATATAKITWHSRTYAIEATKPYRNLDIELEPGVNVLQVAAVAGATITAEYQEGSL